MLSVFIINWVHTFEWIWLWLVITLPITDFTTNTGAKLISELKSKIINGKYTIYMNINVDST